MSIVMEATDEKIIEAYNSSTNYSEMARFLGHKNTSAKVREELNYRITSLGLAEFQRPTVGTKTKDEIFSERTTWQSARSAIQKHARVVYFTQTKEPACTVCGYTNHVEVAHRKSVSSFEGTALISEIKSLENLIGLCPNHHWEFDNQMLEL